MSPSLPRPAAVHDDLPPPSPAPPPPVPAPQARGLEPAPPAPPLEFAPASPEDEDSLPTLLRQRALSTSTPTLVLQSMAGLALQLVALWRHPTDWPLPVLGGATLLAHAAWSVAVRREEADRSPVPVQTPDGTPSPDDAEADEPVSSWRTVRLLAAGAGVASAFGLFSWLGVLLLGRLIS